MEYLLPRPEFLGTSDGADDDGYGDGAVNGTGKIFQSN